jgi:hypothetical protein
MTQSIRDAAAHSKRPRPQRRTYAGTHRRPGAAQRAQYVAESIALRQDEGRAWHWGDYGLGAQPAQQALVLAALARLH